MEGINLPKVSHDHQNNLTLPVTKIEVETALFQMEGNKAPGPDGYSVSFFQHYWELIQNEIFDMVANFFHRGYILKELNFTNLVLIAKKECPDSPGDYRPISLCNVVYRIISKVQANKIKDLMPQLITEFQNAFVKGRNISDNIILAGEMMHHLNKQKKAKNFWCGYKVDFAKAFDKISWDFLFLVLQEMDFPPLWINLIKQCVTTTKIQINFNGTSTQPITPECGLRQGDPLSPYLFLLCLNVLSLKLLKLENDRSITGIKISKGGPCLSHLLYADDCLIFFKANLNSCQQIRKLLDDFAACSGLYVNDTKSLSVFSPNTPQKFVKLMTKTLRCVHSKDISLYLGNYIDGPNNIERSFSKFLETIQSRLQGWQRNLLSRSGRITLIKSVLGSLASYYLFHIRLTKNQAQKCDSIINKFLWRHGQNNNFLHMIKWSKYACQNIKVEWELGIPLTSTKHYSPSRFQNCSLSQTPSTARLCSINMGQGPTVMP